MMREYLLLKNNKIQYKKNLMKGMKVMSIMKKMLTWLICASMLFSCNLHIALAEGWEAATERGITRIGVFSDSHVKNSDAASKLIEALEAFNTVDSNYAGLAMVGDIILQKGMASDNYPVESEPYDAVMGALNTYAKDKPYMWAMGNHEFPYACVIDFAQNETQKGYMEAAVAKSKQYYTEKTGMDLNDDVVIGGYHFITAAPIDYSNVVDAEGEAYMKERIEAAIAADGNEKPIFLTLHHAPWYTTVSSTETEYDQPFSADFTAYLATRPNVIVFTGHTHRSEYDPRTIWQGGYTVINLGHVSNGSGATVEGELVFDRSNSEGVMLEIDKNNVVTIKRMDFSNQCYIGEDWVLDIPKMVDNAGNTAYWKYTDARKAAATAPVFAQNAEITATGITTSSASVVFPQATVENSTVGDTVTKYSVKVVNNKLQTLVQDYEVASDFYRPQNLRSANMTIPITELDSATEYAVTVTAITAFGKTSAELTGTFTTAAVESDAAADAASPEDELREVVYKYVAAKDADGSYSVGYDGIYSPGRNRKEVSADEDGNYPAGNFTASENGVEKRFVNWFSKDTRFGFGDGFVTLFESGNYISFDLSVKKSGIYELLGIAANSISSDMGVYIDGYKKGTFTVPVNESGTYEAMHTGTYKPIGEYPLEAGTHKITFKLENEANSALNFWGAALAKVQDAQVIDMFCTEGTPAAGHYADYSANADTNAYQFYGDGYGAITFTVEAPVNGEYVLSAEAAGGSAANTFTVSVGGTEVTVINIPAGGASTISACTAESTLKLTKGTNTIKLLGGSTSAPFLRGITLVSYDTSDKWAIYPTSSDKVTGFSGANSGDNDLSNDLIMTTNGYITYKITPEKTGKYNILWDVHGFSSASGQTYVNGDTVGQAQSFDGRVTFKNPIETVFSAGNVYEITFKTVSGTVYLFNMKLEYIGEPDNGGEGVYYDLFAGDSDKDNYEEQKANGLKYGDGRGTNGWGCYGGLYAEYDINIEYSGWYDLNLVLGAADDASVQVLIDGNAFATQNAEFVSGEDWAVKRNNDFGKVFLLNGSHALTISGQGGTFQIFKTRLTFDRADDGTAAISFIYDSHDYTGKGGSNVQTSNAAGVVLGEGNSYTEYVVDVPAGNYTLAICYGALNLIGRVSMTVNNAILGTYSLPQNNTYIGRTDYDETNYHNVEVIRLNEGTNKIRLRCEKYVDSNSYGTFSFSSFKLVRLTEPVVQMFAGEYATQDRITEAVDGTLTVRSFLPNILKDKSVEMLACIYKNGALYKVAKTKTASVAVGDVLTVRFTDVEVEESVAYTYKFFFVDSLGSLRAYFPANNKLS